MDDHDGNLPTVEEIEKVWENKYCAPEDPDATEGEEEEEDKQSPEYKKSLAATELITWWMDVFMPLAVGLEFWGPNIRPFSLMTDTKYIDGDVSGEEKVLVTTTSEAYAYQTYANCRDKWIADWNFLKKNPKKSIPKYNKHDSSTFKHKNKWSNATTGSVQGGGWDIAGLEYLQKMITKVGKFREEEEKRGYKRYKLVQKFLKIANDVKLDDTPPKPAGKKRKRDDDEAEKAEDVFKFTYVDE